MNQLFGHKWSSQEGEITEASGQLTTRFLLWCRKTEHLSDADWRRGFEQLEYRVREAGRMGETLWPPSYAEFLGYCEKPFGARAHKPFKRAALEDKTELEKRRKVGLEYSKRILAMFDDDEPKEGAA